MTSSRLRLATCSFAAAILLGCGSVSPVFEDAAVDAIAADGPTVDAAVIDAAAIDASPIDAPADAPSCTTVTPTGKRIAVIESVSGNGGHTMDTRWQSVATAAGHTVTILPQTALDALAGLDGYDILVVSSGVIDLPPARRAVVDGFAASRRGVYLQAEYQITFTTNVAFGEIVNGHGGAFTWTGTVEGMQDPVTVSGCLATMPEPAAQLTGYWYAATGTGAAPGLEVIHTAPTGQPIGWAFCLPGGGLVISNTDQDFVLRAMGATDAHLRNVLVRLADARHCAGGGGPG